jgi:CheY-like chemotaxis protein
MTNNFQDFENAKILVIDDEVVNLDIIEELLERDGFSNVSFFSDPSEAVKFYKNTPPDLVILDLNMPVLTGFDVM